MSGGFIQPNTLGGRKSNGAQRAEIGEFFLDGQIVPVKPGSIIRVATATARAWRNTGSVPAALVCVQYPEAGRVTGTSLDGKLVDTTVAWDTAKRI